MPISSSMPAMVSESCAFIWQPSVTMQYFISRPPSASFTARAYAFCASSSCGGTIFLSFKPVYSFSFEVVMRFAFAGSCSGSMASIWAFSSSRPLCAQT